MAARVINLSSFEFAKILANYQLIYYVTSLYLQ